MEGGKGKSSHFRLASQGPIVKSTKRIQVSLEGNDILGARWDVVIGVHLAL